MPMAMHQSIGTKFGPISGLLTFLKWSYKVTCPSLPVANRRAYSAFLIECIDTASVMVSTSPELFPVINILKLMFMSGQKLGS